MSAEVAVERVLARLSDEQVAALADAVETLSEPDGELVGHVAGAGPAAAGDVTSLSEAWGATPGLTGAGLALALRVGLVARQEAEAHRSTAVWTGPGAVGQQRLTAGVLHQLVSHATRHILLVSYATQLLPELAADLRHAAARGCSVDLVFETAEDNDNFHGHGYAAFDGGAGITRWRWPADRREPKSSLHAKVLVIDRRLALVGSANLTQFALTRNLEAGVLIRDTSVAAALDDHVRRLMESGTLTAVETRL